MFIHTMHTLPYTCMCTYIGFGVWGLGSRVEASGLALGFRRFGSRVGGCMGGFPRTPRQVL